MGKCAYRTPTQGAWPKLSWEQFGLRTKTRRTAQGFGVFVVAGNIDLGHIASSRWPEQCFSAFATWYHGHKRGTHGRLITQFMPARYRTGPLSSLITGHSKFTPIENTKNSCHGGMWTFVFCTRYRPANIRVIAPIWAVSRHLGGPDRAHHSPRPASDCLAHQPSARQ